ncbi:hypothetical protein [Edaphobacter sp.]
MNLKGLPFENSPNGAFMWADLPSCARHCCWSSCAS